MNPDPEIQALQTKYGITPEPSKTDGDVQSRLSELDTAWGTSKPSPSYGEKVGQEQLAGGQKIISSVQEGASQIEKGINAQKPEDLLNIPAGIARAEAGAVVGAGQVMVSAITPAVKSVVDKLVQVHPELATDFSYDNMSPMGKAIVDKIKQYPEQASLIGDVVNAALTFMGAKGVEKVPELKTPVSQVAGDLKQGVTDLATQGKEAIVGTPEAKAVVQKSADLQSLKEKIMPKPTVKEARLATEQGRLFKGKEASTFKSGKPDQIAVSDQEANSIQTVDRLIPDHVKMDEPTLYSALDEKISSTAQALKPEAEAVAIKPETIQKINDDWTNLKKTQMTEAKATDEPNVAKWQKNFEKFLTKSKNENLNDLWETAKEYDRSIKANVKNATEQSPEDLQVQKDIWLENRRILKDAINDGKNGLGTKSKQAFSDMTDMYEAQNGILSKAKVETKVQPSKIGKFFQSKTGKAIKYGATGAIGAAVGAPIIKDLIP